MGYWVVDLVRWYERHKDFVNQKTFKDDTGRYWFTHKSARKALIHIKRAKRITGTISSGICSTLPIF
jgi:hypothetical protein